MNLFYSLSQSFMETIEIQHMINDVMAVTNMTQDEIVKLHDETKMSYKDIYDKAIKGEKLN